MSPKTQVTKEKADKLDYIKMKNVCASKDTIKKMKRQPSDWKKIFTNRVLDQSLVSRISIEFLQLPAPHQKGQQIRIHMSPKEAHVTNKHMKRCSTSFAIGEVKIKTTRTCH